VRKTRGLNEYLCVNCRKIRFKSGPEFDSIGEAGQVYNFNRESHHGKLPGFDELFDLFSNDCNTLTSIGQRFGLARADIRQIYNKYFRKFLRGKSGIARKKICSRLSKLNVITGKFNQLPMVGLLLEITDGRLEIKPVVSYSYRSYRSQGGKSKKVKYLCGIKPSKKFAMINGHKCLVKNVSDWQYMTDYALRAHLSVTVSRNSLMSADFLIIISEKDGEKLFFIVPVSAILEIFPDKIKYWRVYISSTNVVYHNNSPRIDFWKYEKAWHFLEKPKHASQEKIAVPA